jgi:hypothetical protein
MNFEGETGGFSDYLTKLFKLHLLSAYSVEWIICEDHKWTRRVIWKEVVAVYLNLLQRNNSGRHEELR